MSKRGYLSLALISAAMLVFEIGLTRLFAVQQFHHFAFMVVSLALLGMAASGIALSLFKQQPPLAWLGLAFTGSLALAYFLMNSIPFDSYAIAWNPDQVGVLLIYFVAAGLPFLLAGWAAGLGLARAGAAAYRPYAAVMLGSALGAPLALVVHQWGGALVLVAAAGALASLASALAAKRWWDGGLAWLAFATSAIVLLWQPGALSLTLSDYKPLAVARRSLQADVGLTDWGPVTRLDAVEGAAIHVMPGLSPRPGVELPEQVGLFLDGDGPIPISKIDPGSAAARALAARMPSEVGFRLRPNARTLILQPGAGLEAQLALARQSEYVTLARDEPLVASALRGRYRSASSQLLDDQRVEMSARSTRGLLADPADNYQLIIYALSDPFRPIQSGAFSLTENYALTQESFQSAFRALDPGGIVMISRWLSTPPSESVRTWATMVAALRAEGIENPGDHLIAFRGLRTATILASRQPLNPAELRTVRQALNENAWDPVHLPDLKADELNRQNVLPEPAYANLFASILEDPVETIANSDFRLEPTRDNRPYFFHFFRWRQTAEVVRTLGLRMQPFGGSGYLVLLVLLALMVGLSLPLILVPWWGLKRRGIMLDLPWRATAYFGALGAGYLLIEIPLISQLILLLEQPSLALGTVLFTILLASGFGSLLSPRLPLRRTLFAITLIALTMIILLPLIIQWALGWSLLARLAISMITLLPLGLLMGVPFAAGLARLDRSKPGIIPWAWGVNGATSGISGVLAAMIAIDLGFSAVLAVGAAIYLVARLTIPADRT